jgi:hypothetical protein
VKISVYLKDPDGFSESIQEAAKADVAKLGLGEQEAKVVAEMRAEEAGKALSRWVEYGECVALEFDTEAMTATVVRRDQ